MPSAASSSSVEAVGLRTEGLESGVAAGRLRDCALRLRVGRPPKRRLDQPPQTHEEKGRGGDPHRDVPTALPGDGRERAGRVRVATTVAQRDTDGEVAEDEVQQTAHHVPGAGESLEDGVLCEPRHVHRRELPSRRRSNAEWGKMPV